MAGMQEVGNPGSNVAETAIQRIFDAITRLRLDFDAKFGAMAERLAVFETSFKFHSYRIDQQDVRITALESKAQTLDKAIVPLDKISLDLQAFHSDIRALTEAVSSLKQTDAKQGVFVKYSERLFFIVATAIVMFVMNHVWQARGH